MTLQPGECGNGASTTDRVGRRMRCKMEVQGDLGFKLGQHPDEQTWTPEPCLGQVAAMGRGTTW